jgi:hypothetical protein
VSAPTVAADRAEGVLAWLTQAFHVAGLGEVFAVTPATLLTWHGRDVAG